MKHLKFILPLILAFFIIDGCQMDEKVEDQVQPEAYYKEGAQTENANFCTFPLLAGQDNPIGDVTLTWIDASTVKVVYQITDPLFGMYETHLDLQADADDFPMTKKGNPKVGHFAYGDDELECAGSWSSGEIDLFNADIGWDYGMPVYVAAHAAVIKNCTQPVLYATEYISGTNPTVTERIMGVYTNATTALVVQKSTPWTQPFYTQNGNAYENGYFYFTIFGNYPTPLYFNDLNGTQEPVFAGTLVGKSTGAAFYNGVYYYIDHATDDFRKVTFNPDGTVSSDELIASILDGTENLAPGDIAISADGVVYGSVTRGDVGVFFTMNLDGSGYVELKTGEAPFGTSALQIAFGGDGVLYGVDFTSKIMYTVNPADGETEVIGNVGISMGDIASGVMWEDESAWAGEEEFPGNNWATYFSCCISPQIINGSFEFPSISQGWTWFPNDYPGIGWTIEWDEGSNDFGGCEPNSNANLEYHNNVWANLPAANGNQYVEMDTHASGCGSKANVRISQELATCIGEVYAISFAWRPRLNPSNSDCKLEVYWGGDLKVTYDNTNYVGNANGGWDYETIEVTGSGLVTLSFVETGDPDQLGTFLDAILIQ